MTLHKLLNHNEIVSYKDLEFLMNKLEKQGLDKKELKLSLEAGNTYPSYTEFNYKDKCRNKILKLIGVSSILAFDYLVLSIAYPHDPISAIETSSLILATFPPIATYFFMNNEIHDDNLKAYTALHKLLN